MTKKILLPKIVKEGHRVGTDKYDYSQVEVVEGFLDASESTDFQAPKLTTVKGFLWADESTNYQVPSLTTVEGNLNAWNSNNFQAPSLTTVKGDLNAEESNNLLLPKLTTVGGYLDAGYSKNLLLSNLTTVEGTVWADDTKNFLAPKLITVGKNINPGDYPGTESLQEIYEAPLADLPLLLIEYKDNSFLSERIKQRLQHDPITKDCYKRPHSRYEQV